MRATSSRRVRLRLLFAAVVACCAVPATSAAAQTIHEHSPPPTTSGPTRVAIGIYVTNFAAINESEESYKLVGYILAGWKDPRLAHEPGPVEPRILMAGEAWTPALVIANDKKPREISDLSMSVAPDGSVNYVERFDSEMSANLRLRRFPFDRQELDIVLESFLYDENEVVLSEDPALLGHSSDSYAALAEWTIQGLSHRTGKARFDGTSELRSRFTVSLHIKRHSGYYVTKVFFPLLLITILCWSALWIDPDRFDVQVGLAVTTLLTAIAFSLAVNSSLPRVGYLTLTDAFISICYAAVFGIIATVVALHAFTARGQGPRARVWQSRARWSVAVGFVAFAVAVPFVVR